MQPSSAAAAVFREMRVPWQNDGSAEAASAIEAQDDRGASAVCDLDGEVSRDDGERGSGICGSAAEVDRFR